MKPHSRGADASGFCNSVALEEQRAQGMPGARRTHCLACKTKKTHAGSTQVRRNHSGTPCAMVLRLLRALPGVPGFLATIACAACRTGGPTSPIRKLDSSIGEPEPHGLTVRAVPHVWRRHASIATRLTSGDEWPSRPPCRGGLASLNHNFGVSESNIFLQRALDTSGKTGGGFLPLSSPSPTSPAAHLRAGASGGEA